jgi:hypothetical protein
MSKFPESRIVNLSFIQPDQGHVVIHLRSGQNPPSISVTIPVTESMDLAVIKAAAIAAHLEEMNAN